MTNPTTVTEAHVAQMIEEAEAYMAVARGQIAEAAEHERKAIALRRGADSFLKNYQFLQDKIAAAQRDRYSV